MNVLFVSNLYPNSLEPSRGVFNEYQIRHLAKRCPVKVVAPIAWFPIRGRYAPPGELPKFEVLHDIEVHHPRHFYVPKIARRFNAALYASGIKQTVYDIYDDFRFEVIFVNWTYPDACGVARLAQHFNVPFVTSVSGSDAHVFLTMRDRAAQIVNMFRQAAAVTTRSQDLKDMLLAHGVDGRKVNVVYNGVDGARFQSIPRAEARKRLGLDPARQILLYVGRLSPEKGPDDLVRALAHARQYYAITPQLVFVGDGPLRASLQQLAGSLGVTDLIVWAGWKKPHETRDFFCAADFLCLPSQNEGVANVVLESFSCGLPVIATAVGGIPEIMTAETGLLAAPCEPASLAAAIYKAGRRVWDPEVIRRHGARFDWNANAEFIESILRRAVEQHGRPQDDTPLENAEDLD